LNGNDSKTEVFGDTLVIRQRLEKYWHLLVFEVAISCSRGLVPVADECNVPFLPILCYTKILTTCLPIYLIFHTTNLYAVIFNHVRPIFPSHIIFLFDLNCAVTTTH
jgi:hypothetical protein